MKALPIAVAVIASLTGLACSGAEARPSPTSEAENNPDVPDEFFITIADESLTTPHALLALAFFEDGAVNVELSFQVGDEAPRTSLVLRPFFDQLERGRFEAPLVDAPLAEGNGNWFVSGKPVADGVVAVTISPHGALSGNAVAAAFNMDFSGKFLLSCSVPASSLPNGAEYPAAPVPSDGRPGEVLVADALLTSIQCSEASQVLDWP